MLKTMLVFLLSFVVCSTYADTPVLPPQHILLINNTDLPIQLTSTINSQLLHYENGTTIEPHSTDEVDMQLIKNPKKPGYFEEAYLIATASNPSDINGPTSLLLGIEAGNIYPTTHNYLPLKLGITDNGPVATFFIIK